MRQFARVGTERPALGSPLQAGRECLQPFDPQGSTQTPKRFRAKPVWLISRSEEEHRPGVAWLEWPTGTVIARLGGRRAQGDPLNAYKCPQEGIQWL